MGVATHMILDVISKAFGRSHTISGSIQVVLWPILGWAFPTLSYGMHGSRTLIFEMFGGALLILQLAIKRFRPSLI